MRGFGFMTERLSKWITILIKLTNEMKKLQSKILTQESIKEL